MVYVEKQYRQTVRCTASKKWIHKRYNCVRGDLSLIVVALGVSGVMVQQKTLL